MRNYILSQHFYAKIGEIEVKEVMKTLYIKDIEGLTSLELLEQIYTKVKLGEYIKFNGHAYRRIRTLDTKFAKYPYHFTDCGDIYEGSFLAEDDDGEDVKILCKYKIVVL